MPKRLIVILLAAGSVHAAEVDDAKKLCSEIDRLGRETAQMQSDTKQSRAALEKLKTDVAKLREIRGEAAKNFVEGSSEHDRNGDQIAQLTEEKQQLEAELAQNDKQEKAKADKLAKARADYAAKKTKLDAEIAALKARYKEAQARIAKMDDEEDDVHKRDSALEAQKKTAETETANAEAEAAGQPANAGTRAIASAKASDGDAGEDDQSGPTLDQGGITFKKRCRVFDGPTRDAQVIDVQSAGASFIKNGEGQTYYAFPLTDGRKGFAAKSCF